MIYSYVVANMTFGMRYPETEKLNKRGTIFIHIIENNYIEILHIKIGWEAHSKKKSPNWR